MNATQASGPQRHLLAVWNPSYTASDAMDDHIAILLREAARLRRGDIDDEEEVFVWWGKVRSANRLDQELPNERDIREMRDELAGDGGLDREVHLYLTDYRSLYVGHVVEIFDDDARQEDPELVPAYYSERGLSCDWWFRLADIRRLVHDDLPGVIEALRELSVVHYGNRPVSLYGGIRDLPIIVTRAIDERYFGAAQREQYADKLLWAEFDSRQGATADLERDLRENVVGERAWSALHPTARSFIAAAEGQYRRHRGEAGYDFGSILAGFARALELHLNHLLRLALSGAGAAARRANIDGRTIDVVSDGPLTLGQLMHAISGEREMQHALKLNLQRGEWFVVALPGMLEDFAPLRNHLMHGGTADRATAQRWRDRLLGVGCDGLLTALEQARVIKRGA